MSNLWPFVVIGIFTGSIYALASMGVVLTYKTTGVFNFAYGAVAMFCAYTYWQLHDSWHLTAWIAMPVLLLVVAPLLGIVSEALFRSISGHSAEVQIVVSLGVLAALEAAVPLLYGAQDRPLQPIFPISTFVLAGHLHVGYDQLGTLLVALAVGGGLWWLLRHTRFGISTRAVVDNRDLATMIGVNDATVRRTAWILSSIFAGLVGVLLSPTQGLDVYVLTVVVIYAFAPAVAGRLTSLPIAFAAALGLGVVQSVLSKWGSSGTVADLEAAIPYLALFVLLIFFGGRLKELGQSIRPTTQLDQTATAAVGAATADAPGPDDDVADWPERRDPFDRWGLLGRGRRRLALPALGRPVLIGAIGFVLLFALPVVVQGPRLDDATAGAIIAMVGLTLVVLTGWAGQISLAQFSFVGVGAFTAGHLAGAHGQHFALAALVGMAIAVPVGLLVGLPSLRISGLFLALATMAFALLMDTLVFNRPGVSGGLTGMTVARPEILGLSFTGRIAFYELMVVVLAVLVAGAYFLRRGPIGRRLHILRDSPLAASTLGVNLMVTKLVTFAVCGMVAALAGTFYGAFSQTITPTDFSFAASLELLLLVVLGGRSVISGAVIAGAVYAVQLLPIPLEVAKFIPLTIAAGVVGIGAVPEGSVALTVRETRRCLSVLRPHPRRLVTLNGVGAAARPAPEVTVAS